MVKKYSSVGGLNKIKLQHEEIISWLESTPEFADCSVFLEFRVPSRKNRDVDVLIIQSNSIFLLELKDKDFTKISINDFWEYWDSKSSSTKVLEKFWSGRKENPYDQAVNTANDLRDWMKKNVRKFVDYPRLMQFIKSDEFKIFPLVYIPSSCTILPENIERLRWCKLCVGKQDLSKYLKRTWKKFNNLIFGSDEIEDLAELLSISDHLFSRKGKDSQTLISIIQYMLENDPKWVHEDEIKQEVFASGEKTIREIRKALKKAKKIGLIRLEENFYALHSVLPRIIQKGYEISDLYNIWEKVVRLSDFERNDPKIFQIFASDIIVEVIDSSDDALDIMGIYRQFPLELLLYRFPKIMAYKERTIPEFSRKEGLLWADIQNNYFIPFTNDDEEDLVIKIISNLQNSEKILIIGNASTGKTSLIRILGYELLQRNIPVLLLSASDLDSDFLESLYEYDKIVKDKNYSEIVVIIENIHAATAEQLNILKLILRSVNKIQIVMTSRQSEIYLNSKDILKAFTSNGNEIIDLNSHTQLNFRAKSYIELILSQIFPSTNLINLQRFRDHLVSEIKGAWPLLQLEIGILKDSIQANNSKRLLENKQYHQQEFRNHLLSEIETQVRELKQIESLHFSDKKIREILLIFYYFVELEVPIRSDLLQSICNLNKEQSYALIKFWSDSCNISSENDNLPTIHPVFAGTILETLPSHFDEWKQAQSGVQYTLNQNPGKSIIAKIRYKLLELDPSLMEVLRTEEFDPNSINFNNLTLDDLIDYSLSLSLDDLANFLYSYSNHGSSNFQKLCILWNTLKIEKIRELIETSSSLYASLHFMNVIFNSRWYKFWELLESFSPEFFISQVESNPSEIHDLIYYLKCWNYSRYQIVEVKNIIQQLMNKNPNSFTFPTISNQGISILNQLNPNKVLKILLNAPESNIWRFLNFLSNINKDLKKYPHLFVELFILVLHDSGKKFGLDILDDFLRFLHPDMISDYQGIYDAINKWDNYFIHEKLVNAYTHQVSSFLSNIENLEHPKIKSLINIFSVKELFQIWENQDETREYPPSLMHFTEHLQNLNWTHIPEFLDEFHIKDLIEIILPANEEKYEDTGLLNLLLKLEWPQSLDFISSFDFIEWAKRHQFFHYQHIIENIFSYDVPNQKEIIKTFFTIYFYERNYYSRDFEQILQYCNQRNWDWHKWVDISHLQKLSETNLHQAKEKIDFFIEQGWKIPDELSESLMIKEYNKEQNYIANLSLVEKAEYLYRQGKRQVAMDIMLSFLRQENSELESSIFRSLIYNIRQSFSKEDQKQVVDNLSPDFFLVSEYQNRPSRFFNNSLVYAKYLKEMGYSHIPQILVNLYMQIRDPYLEDFWSRVQSHEILQNTEEKICKILWKNHEFYYMMRLPATFTEYIVKYYKDIIRLLKQGSQDSFLWGIYYRILSNKCKVDNTDDDLLFRVISTVYLDFDTLEPILSLLSKKKNMELKIINEFNKLSNSLKKTVIFKSNHSQILRFFTYQSQISLNNQISPRIYIELLSKDEWEEKVENCEEKYKNIFILLIRSVYPAFLTNFEGIEENLGLK